MPEENFLQSRRRTLEQAGLLLGGIGLAGCSSDTSEQTPTETNTDTPSPTSTETATQTEETTEEPTPTEEPVKLDNELISDFKVIPTRAGFTFDIQKIARDEKEAVREFSDYLFRNYEDALGLDVDTSTHKQNWTIEYSEQGIDESKIRIADMEIIEDKTGDRIGSHKNNPIFEYVNPSNPNWAYLVDEEQGVYILSDKLEETKELYNRLFSEDVETHQTISQGAESELITEDTVAVGVDYPISFSEMDYVTLNSMTESESYHRMRYNDGEIIEEVFGMEDGEMALEERRDPKDAREMLSQ
jgi:hypothetical protein